MASGKDQDNEQHAKTMVAATHAEKDNDLLGKTSDNPPGRRKAVAKSGTGVVVHGTSSGYNRGCDCKLCTDRHSKRMKDYRERRKIEGRSRGTMVTLTCDRCGIAFPRRKANRPAVKGHRKAYCPDCWWANRRTTAVGAHSAPNVSSSNELPVDHQEQVLPEAA
jgi:hypothetical protein